MENAISEAFIEQVNLNLGIAHKVCKAYFSDTHDQEDAFQEMMYQLWKSYPGFERRSKFSTWMYRVCLNTAITFKKKSDELPKESITSVHYQIGEPDSFTKEQSIQLLYEAIKHLSPLNKAIVLLYLDDMSYEEIADITGLTRSNVSVKLVRIKKELEIQLRKNPNSKENVNF